MKKRVLWLALTGLMVLSLLLVSCGTKTPATTSQTSATTAATSKPTTATSTATSATTTKPTSVSTSVATTTSASAGTPKYGSILKIGDYRLATTLGNPAKQNAGYAMRENLPAMETLLRVDKTGQITPFLAKSYVEDPKNLTLTLTLNTGITFHDGTPFNAAAVKWNLDQDKAANQTGTTLMKSIDVVNDNTVKITLTQWDNTVLGTMAYHFIGQIISPTAAQKNPADWTLTHIVGTGPFVFETWIPQVTISYSKNANYWQQGKPYLDRVENVIIADQTVGLMNFKAGKTDQFIDPNLSDMPDLKKNYPATVSLPFAAFATTRGGGIFDSADPKSPMADLRVRQALSYAINSDEINKSIYSGFGQVTNGFISTDNYGYNPNTVGYPYNPTKAKQLLADAGYSTTNPLKFTHYDWNIEPYMSVAQACKGYWNAIGVDCSLVLESNLALNQSYLKWDGTVGITAIPSPDPVFSLMARHMGLDPRYMVEQLVPQDYKQAVLDAAAAPDIATKIKKTQEADKLFIDKYCLAAVWTQVSNNVVNQSWIHGDGLYVVASSSLWTPENAWKDPGH